MTDETVRRRLRLVRPTDLGDGPIVTQVADMPDAYRVRRQATADALMARSRGDWVILFGWAPGAGGHAVDGWTRQVVLGGSHGDREAAEIALALAAAYDNPVGVYADLMCAAVHASVPALVELLRLHAPFAATGAEGPALPAVCTGESGPAPLWHECVTVKIIASSLGVELPG